MAKPRGDDHPDADAISPAALDAYGLLAAARWHIDRYQARTGVRVDFRHEGLDRRFTPVVETSAYRVLQEALTNVARHGEVKAASVRVLADTTMLTVAISNGGRGFDSAHPRVASGLSGMEVARRLQSQAPDTRVIMLSMHDRRADVRRRRA